MTMTRIGYALLLLAILAALLWTGTLDAADVIAGRM